MNRSREKPDPRRGQAGRPVFRMTGSGSLFFKHLVDANGHENYRAAGRQQARQMTPLGKPRSSYEAAYAAPDRPIR